MALQAILGGIIDSDDGKNSRFRIFMAYRWATGRNRTGIVEDFLATMSSADDEGLRITGGGQPSLGVFFDIWMWRYSRYVEGMARVSSGGRDDFECGVGHT